MGWIQHVGVARIGTEQDGDSSVRSGVRLVAQLIAAYAMIGAVVVVVATAASGAPLGNEQSQPNPPSEDSPPNDNFEFFDYCHSA